METTAPTFASRANRRPRALMIAKAKLLTFCATLVAVLVLLVGSAAPADAHAGHDHGPPAQGFTLTLSVPQALPLAIDAVVVTDIEIEKDGASAGRSLELAVPLNAPQPLHLGNCCCGSIACHAAVAAPLIEVAPGCVYRMRFEPQPAGALIGTEVGGLERPPRSVLPL